MVNKMKLGLLGLGILANSFLYSQTNPNLSGNENLESKVVYETPQVDSTTLELEEYVINAIKKELNENELQINWKEIDKGLYFTEIHPKKKSIIGNSKISVLKIDPKYYKFNLISSKENNEKNKTAKEWAESKGLLAAINAGMYRGDYQTNTGFMKSYDFVNNNKLENDYNAIVAFNRKDKAFPEFQIIDLKCQSWDEMKDKYNSYVQGIRMIDCNQNNVWSQQNKKWSISAIGKDKDGNALFIFTRSPYSVYDFNNILLESPLNIYNAMYLEGGPEASFYLNHNKIEIEKFGSYETDFYESDENKQSLKIPNIIGITKK